MSEENKTNALTDEELGGASGGASDYTTQGCTGSELSSSCVFCTCRLDGQHVFLDGGLRDTIGCSLSSEYLGQVNGTLLVGGVLKSVK